MMFKHEFEITFTPKQTDPAYVNHIMLVMARLFADFGTFADVIKVSIPASVETVPFQGKPSIHFILDAHRQKKWGEKDVRMYYMLIEHALLALKIIQEVGLTPGVTL